MTEGAFSKLQNAYKEEIYGKAKNNYKFQFLLTKMLENKKNTLDDLYYTRMEFGAVSNEQDSDELDALIKEINQDILDTLLEEATK